MKRSEKRYRFKITLPMIRAREAALIRDVNGCPPHETVQMHPILGTRLRQTGGSRIVAKTVSKCMPKQKTNWPYTSLSSGAMAVIVSDAVKWYIDDIDSKDAGNQHWAEAQAEQLGFMVSIWVAKHGGPACGTCDAVSFLGLKDAKKLRRRSTKKWADLFRILKFVYPRMSSP